LYALTASLLAPPPYRFAPRTADALAFLPDLFYRRSIELSDLLLYHHTILPSSSVNGAPRLPLRHDRFATARLQALRSASAGSCIGTKSAVAVVQLLLLLVCILSYCRSRADLRRRAFFFVVFDGCARSATVDRDTLTQIRAVLSRFWLLEYRLQPLCRLAASPPSSARQGP
jgi:hypothetical protein